MGGCPPILGGRPPIVKTFKDELVTRRDVRTEILAAAEQIAIEHGFGGVTTKEVARVAGCSQGSIYNHFQDRTDLLAQVVANRMLSVTAELRSSGLGSADGGMNLRALVRAVAGAYEQLIALSTSLVADPEVRLRFQAVLEDRGTAPDSISDAVTVLISASQTAELIRTDVDAEMVALLVTGPCHQAALHAHVSALPQGLPRELETKLAHTLETLLRPV
jgi:AcrR family transcriptional regulator